MLLIADKWQDYELLDAGDGEKLERWGEYILRRPDPQAIWPVALRKHARWDNPDLLFGKDSEGVGNWQGNGKDVPDSWEVGYSNLKFTIMPTTFKHTALFPEQAVNWDFITNRIKEKKAAEFRVLNLFAYTGGASVAALAAGATEVVHVDSSRGMLGVAKRNVELSGLAEQNMRLIHEDALGFVKREVRRGRAYHGIIMDPPPFGRGDQGQVWKLERDLPRLLELCAQLLDPQASFMIVNTYAVEITHIALANLLTSLVVPRLGGEASSGELAIPISAKNMLLPAGIYARWQS